MKRIISILTSVVMIFALGFYFPKNAKVSAATTQVDLILNYGRSKIGSTDYDQWCQRFVKECYEAAGIYAPYSADSAYEAYTWWCVSKDTSNIPIGAVLYFNTSEYGHAAIFTGNNTMLHGVSTVREETISSWYWNRFLGWGYQAGVQPTGTDYHNEDMTTPTFTLDKSEYHVGDTVTVSWTPSSAKSNLSHYWISVYCPGDDIQRRIDPPTTTTSFVVDQVGEYTINMQATPRGSVAGEGSLSSIQTIYVTDPVTMTSPEFTFDKNVYYVGDTVNVTWKESSPESNLDHYWISVYSPGGATDVQERIDPPASSISFIPTQEGEHTVRIWATPRGLEAGEGSLTVEQSIYVRSLKSELTVLPGSSTEATKFNWSATRDNKEYNLRIFNGELWNSEEVGTAWLLKDTSYECVLPAGHYNAYIDTVFSDDSVEMSNVVEFDVAVSIPAAPKLSIAKEAYDSESLVSVKWDKVNEASSYWLHIYKDGKDYANKSLNQDLEYTAQYSPGTYVMYVTSRNEAGEGVANVNFTVYTKGDCNGDGEFNVSDVVLLQKWLLAVPDTHFENWKAANLCDDDRLNVFDLCLMKRKLIYG